MLVKQRSQGPFDDPIGAPWRVCANGSRYTGQAYARNADGQFLPTGMFYRDGKPTMKDPLRQRMKNAFTITVVLLAICAACLAIFVGGVDFLAHLH